LRQPALADVVAPENDGCLLAPTSAIDDLAQSSGILRDAARGKGNFGLGSATAARGMVTIHQADCLIAAATIEIGATLATANAADFPMPDLEIQSWPVGT
jgi:predicted nucleic acid-binding protein